MTKMLDMACSSGSCGGTCPRVVARAVTDARSSAGLRTEVLDTTNKGIGFAAELLEKDGHPELANRIRMGAQRREW